MKLTKSIWLFPLLSMGLVACGGGGGGGSKPPASSLAASSKPAVSSAASTSVVASSSSVASSVYSANVDSLRSLAEFPIGAAVSNTDSRDYNLLTNVNEQAVVEKHFNQLTAGNIMKMSYLQPRQGDFTFDNADDFVAYAGNNGMQVHGHALVWHSDYQVPQFMKDWSNNDKDGFLAALDTHVTTVVNHFKAAGNIKSWDVVNEALDDGDPSNFRTNSTFYVKSGNSAVYIERAFQAARAADPNAVLYYNDYNIDQNNAKTDKMIEMIKDFKTRDIPLDGIGFQMHVFMDYPSIADITTAMQKVIDADPTIKVKITELDVAVNNPYNPGWPGNKITRFDQATALAQKKRYCEIVKAYLDTVPEDRRGGITVWGTTDASTWLTTATAGYNGEAIAWPLLFDDNYNDKPALRGFADALEGKACSDQ